MLPLRITKAKRIARQPIDPFSSRLMKWQAKHFPARQGSMRHLQQSMVEAGSQMCDDDSDLPLSVQLSPLCFTYTNVYSVDALSQVARGVQRLRRRYSSRRAFDLRGYEPKEWFWRHATAPRPVAWARLATISLDGTVLSKYFDECELSTNAVSHGFACVSASFTLSGRFCYEMEQILRGQRSPVSVYRKSVRRRRGQILVPISYPPSMVRQWERYRLCLIAQIGASNFLNSYFGHPIERGFLWPALEAYQIDTRPPAHIWEQDWRRVLGFHNPISRAYTGDGMLLSDEDLSRELPARNAFVAALLVDELSKGKEREFCGGPRGYAEAFAKEQGANLLCVMSINNLASEIEESTSRELAATWSRGWNGVRAYRRFRIAALRAHRAEVIARNINKRAFQKLAQQGVAVARPSWCSTPSESLGDAIVRQLKTDRNRMMRKSQLLHESTRLLAERFSASGVLVLTLLTLLVAVAALLVSLQGIRWRELSGITPESARSQDASSP